MRIRLWSASIWRNRSFFSFFVSWHSSTASQFPMTSTGKFTIGPVIVRRNSTVEHRMIAGIWSRDSMMFSAESLSEKKNAFSLKLRNVSMIGNRSSLKWLKSAAWSVKCDPLFWLVTQSISNFDPPNSRLIGSNWLFIHSHLFSIGMQYPQ